MNWKIGDKFKDKADREWTVIAKTVGGKKMWIAHLAQVLDMEQPLPVPVWKYTNRMLIDADYDGDPNKDVTGVGHGCAPNQIGEGGGALRVDPLQ
jgi:hypothetical protein